MNMHHSHRFRPRISFALIAGLSLLLMFVLAACGATSGGGGTGSAPGSNPTSGSGSTSNTTGCPNNASIPSGRAANVLIKPSQANTTITAHMGDIIEVRLPFGHKWGGPTTSQGQLELQAPFGYASTADGVCVWRFVAKGTGTIQLNFTSQALCKPGELCPQYIMSIPFTIDVK